MRILVIPSGHDAIDLAEGCPAALNRQQAGRNEDRFARLREGVECLVVLIQEQIRENTHFGEALRKARGLGDAGQRIVTMGCIGPVKRAESVHLIAIQSAKARGLVKVLAFDIKHHHRSRKAQKVRDHESHPLTGAGRGHHHHMRDHRRRYKWAFGIWLADLATNKAAPGILQHIVFLKLGFALPMGGAIFAALALEGPGKGKNTKPDDTKSYRPEGHFEGLGMRQARGIPRLPDGQHIKIGKPNLKRQREIEAGDDRSNYSTTDRTDGDSRPERK